VIEKVLEKILNRTPVVVFDVGANTGEYAVVLGKAFPMAAIYCFEPLPNNFKTLDRNTAGLKTINIMTALGKEEGYVSFSVGKDNPDGSMATIYKETLENIFTFVGDIYTVPGIPMTTIDSYSYELIKTIDFLKIDVEGHELEILKGATKMIAENRINIIQFEFNEFNIISKSFMYDFYQILKDYDFYRIMPQNKLFPMGDYKATLEIFLYQNILAINKSLNYRD
jgi:FkbM family methyltransferase